MHESLPLLPFCPAVQTAANQRQKEENDEGGENAPGGCPVDTQLVEVRLYRGFPNRRYSPHHRGNVGVPKLRQLLFVVTPHDTGGVGIGDGVKVRRLPTGGHLQIGGVVGGVDGEVLQIARRHWLPDDGVEEGVRGGTAVPDTAISTDGLLRKVRPALHYQLAHVPIGVGPLGEVQFESVGKEAGVHERGACRKEELGVVGNACVLKRR